MKLAKIGIVLVLVFVAGVSTGYYLMNASQSQDAKNVLFVKNGGGEKDGEKSNLNLKNLKSEILLKIDLLKSYTDFVLLPKVNIENPEKFADDMAEKVKAINNPEITNRFYATGEQENREQKIIDFLDFLNESIKADLN